MVMEKHSQDDGLLLQQLIDEEHQLMAQISAQISNPEKTASEERTVRQSETRLSQVRSKIYELHNRNQQNLGKR